LKILVTNDDGISAAGLYALKQALDKLGEVAVIAPSKNRSAVARAITIGESLDVVEIKFADGGRGYSVDGTPVDCVRLASLGFLEWTPDIVVSGINMGPNLGDDITYSGTVAAAFEGIMLGIPAIAVSIDRAVEGVYHFEAVADFSARVAARLVENHIPGNIPGNILLNINAPNLPAEDIRGVDVTRLGKRIYRDQLIEEAGDGNGRKRFHIYGDDPSYHEEEGTDFHAINQHKISVTPIHFALTNLAGMEIMSNWDLNSLLRPEPKTT
jgi:5'-nucleotidase